MGLRLFGWWHRGAVPAGRHARPLPVVTVPGAAASLVGSAARDPLVTAVGVETPRLPRGLGSSDQAQPELPPAAGPAVGLVFADGESVRLAEDDPRVRTFRAAADALVEHSPS